MRCFVTGASGHIGSYLVRRLLADGHAVAALMRPASSRAVLGDALAEVQVIEGDLLSSTYHAPLASFAPDVVYHLAWWGITAEDRNAPQQVTANVRGTLDLLEAAHNAGAELFVSTGSQAEYGRVSGSIAEDHPLRPETAYGIAKAALSQYLVPGYCDRVGMRSIWLRIFSVYGPGDAATHMMPTLIESLLDHQRPALTKGEQKWDYLHIEDTAAAIAEAGATPQLSGVFNVASGRVVPLRDVIEQVRDLIDPALPLGIGDLPYRHDQVMHLQGDITRLRLATGWEPTVDLEDGLRNTVNWHKGKRHELAS
jgi:nucleoside-diphosphate-sugar epimerase